MFSRLLVLLATVLVSNAASAWEVGHFKDRMTDRQETFATVTSNGARLYVGCKNGQVFPEVRFPRRVGVYKTGATYRFDAGPVVPRIAPLSADGQDLWLWLGSPAAGVAQIRGAKRLRVNVGPEFLDFNLKSGDALPEIQCRG